MDKKLLRNNIWKFYAITALGIRFITPIRILYLLSFGLSYAQIGMMELGAALAVVILEIPSGVFADLFGRKKARLIAYILSILAFTIMSFGSTSYIFIFGWMLSGAADAFQSGAQDALIFDTLKELEKEKEYIKIKSHFVFINAFSVIIGSVAGSFIYAQNHRFPWYLITLTIIVSMIIFISVKEPKYTPKYSNIWGQIKYYKRSLVSSLSNIGVVRILLFSVVLMVPMYVFTTLINQPYLISRGFSVESLGMVFAIIIGLGGVIASFSYKFEPYFKQQLSFIFIIIFFTLILISMGLIKSMWVILLVVGFYIVDNFKNVIIDNYLNEAIKSESRATVLSVQSFVNNIFISIIFLFIGYLVDIYSIDFVLILLGLGVFIFGIPLWLIVSPKYRYTKAWIENIKKN